MPSSNYADLLARWAELRPDEVEALTYGRFAYDIRGHVSSCNYYVVDARQPSRIHEWGLAGHALDCIERDGWLPRPDCIGQGLYSASALGPKGQAVTMPGIRPVTSRTEAAISLRLAVLHAANTQST